MTTNAYAAKRELFDALAAMVGLAPEGDPLHGFAVAYSWSGALTNSQRLIYGGGVVFEQPGDNDLVDGDERIVEEAAVIAVHLRVLIAPPPAVEPIRATDEMVDDAGAAFGGWLARNPRVCGGNSHATILGGQGDYQPTDGAATSILSYRVRVVSQLVPGQ